jgi:Helix-turn-helix domain
MEPTTLPGRALARRLRALRERHWPDKRVTQRQLAEAFGGDRPLSESLISSWESLKGTAQPPPNWLQAYATFFASRRSVEGGRGRLLGDAELTEEERAARDRLHEELLRFRFPDAVDGHRVPLARPTDTIGGGTWYFADQKPITIVCARLPPSFREKMPYTDPQDPDYVRSYTYADVDALIELFGHIRAVNPAIPDVRIRTADVLEEDDYTAHLVLLGGVDWNPVTRDITRRLKLAVRQGTRTDDDLYNGYFEVGDGEETRRFAPMLDRDGSRVTLREDVAYFFRGLNPYNNHRTITICNGTFGRGTYGSVRALTDARFRDRNEEYLGKRFHDRQRFGVVHRVVISVKGEALTPDWTIEENRLHEWPEMGDRG